MCASNNRRNEIKKQHSVQVFGLLVSDNPSRAKRRLSSAGPETGSALLPVNYVYAVERLMAGTTSAGAKRIDWRQPEVTAQLLMTNNVISYIVSA